MIGARGRGKGGNFVEAGATRCRECVYHSPDAQGLSHAPQVTSEALPYWCILPLMHKVSHIVYIVAHAISNMCSMVCRHLMPHHPHRPYAYAW